MILQTRFAYNACGTNKNFNYRLLTDNFIDTEESLPGLISHIQQGHAINCAWLGNRRRCGENVLGIGLIGLDFDNSEKVEDEKVYQPLLTLEQALSHPFIRTKACLIYTSASHTPEWHRFRVLFRLPEFLTDEAYYRDLIQGIHQGLASYGPDKACKDPCRVFYGNTKAEFPLINPSAVLDQPWMNQVVHRVRQNRVRVQRKFQGQIQAHEHELDAWVLDALACIPPRQLGSGNYWECLQVLMALHEHYGDAAIAIAESWSPSLRGSTWNVQKKLNSFRRSGISIASLFWIAQKYGWHSPLKGGVA